jgi:hypothetical protein
VSEEVSQVNYELPKLGKSKWTISLVFIFLFSLFLYFPISGKIQGMIKGVLAKNPRCPITYEDFGFEFFLPKFVITNLNIPGRCLGRNAKPIFLKKTYLNIRGLSFTPFGPHFMSETELFKNPIEAYFTVGFGKFALNLQDAKINLKNLQGVIPKVKLQGQVNIDALVEFNLQQQLEDLKLHVYSKDLVIPAQKVQLFFWLILS